MLIEIEELEQHILHEIDLTEQLLALLDDHLMDPLVAGGAPRNWFFGQYANDVDIFVRNDKESFKEIFTYLTSNNIGHYHNIKVSDEILEHYRASSIDGVITFQFEKTFQIIRVKEEIINVIDTFPCNISKISYKDFVLKPNPEFIMGVRAQTLMFCNDTNDSYRSKIKRYFPRWLVYGDTGGTNIRGRTAHIVARDGDDENEREDNPLEALLR